MNTRKEMTESDSNGHGARSARPAEMAAAADSSPTAGEFQNFIADIEDLVTSMTSLTGEDLARARAKLNERIAAARESISEVGNEIGQRARKAAHETDQYVHENPWQAIGIGAALGLLIGVLIARHK
jgi:ElaB/YqjD/DUF883 family membrane-anchored ribosome-binding protein